MINIKKAQAQFGIVIIVMAVLLLLGGIFFDDGSDSKSIYLTKKAESKSGNSDDSSSSYSYPDENYLFYLNETEIGRQRKVTQSFPNIELGSKIEYNTVYIGNSFRVNSNPISSNAYTFEVQLSEPKKTSAIMIYFEPKRITGNQELKIYINGKRISQNLATASDIPALYYLTNQDKNNTLPLRITFELVKPAWYEFLTWDKMDVTDLKVVEVKKDILNNVKTYNFDIDKTFLDDVYLTMTFSCDEVKELSESVKATVNGYIIADYNPKCTSARNTVTRNISMNILNSGLNKLELETEGYYTVSYGITSVFFNDQEVYKFNINSFNDIIDVVMYGDFDREVIDLRVNNKILTLRRDEIKSIVSYLRFGTNEIKFMNNPLEIEEFVIEKNEFIY